MRANKKPSNVATYVLNQECYRCLYCTTPIFTSHSALFLSRAEGAFAAMPMAFPFLTFSASFGTMKLRLVIEHDSATGRWSAFFPELPGCASAGDAEEEAITNAKEALDLWFEPTPSVIPPGAKVLEVALT